MEKYFVYLEQLRQSGRINMFGAVPYLQMKFPELYLDQDKAARILQSWMNRYQEDGENKC